MPPFRTNRLRGPDIIANIPVINKIKPFAHWEKEVKERPNSAAHCMPLYVPSAALTPEMLKPMNARGTKLLPPYMREIFNFVRIYKKRSNRLSRS